VVLEVRVNGDRGVASKEDAEHKEGVRSRVA
jgi:hypothetical protein